MASIDELSGLLPATALLIAGLLLAVRPASALQEGEPPAPDTVGTPGPADTAQAAEEEPPPAVLPEALRLPDAGFTRVVAQWNRQELLDETAPSLLGILSRELPGLTSLRAEYFTGPHLLVDGIMGPGFVRVRLDGREMAGLSADAVDLARISPAMLESLRILRRPGGVLVEASSLRRDEPRAYSRIEGATGDPELDQIRGIFTNGLGRNFDFTAAIDFFNIGAGPVEANRFEAWGRFGWTPGDRDAGLELWYRNESIDRALEGEPDFQRSEAFLHGRANLAGGVQADLWAGTAGREISAAPGPGGLPDGPPGGDGGPEESLAQAELDITAVGDRGWLAAGARVRSDDSYASLSTDVTAGLRLAGGLLLDGEARFEIWDDFVSSSAGAGLSFLPRLGLDARLRVAATTGSRVLPRPRGTSPVSVDFRSATAEGSISPGPYRLSHRVSYQDLEAQHPFGSLLDADLSPVRPAELLAFESRLSGPLLPVSDFLESFRVDGVWRYQRRLSPETLLYAPTNTLSGELGFHRFFFRDNLEVRLSGGMGYRDAMLTARPATGAPALVPAQVTMEASVVLRIDTFRLFWRADNMLRRRLADYAGLPHPINPYMFGVRWAFTN